MSDRVDATPHGRIGVAAAAALVALAACRAPGAPGADPGSTLRFLHALVGDSATIVPDGLPSGMSPLLALPAADRVVGTVARARSVEVYVASGLPLDSVGPVYGARLADRGWVFEVPPGGLRERDRIIEGLCHPDGRRLTLDYAPGPSGTVEVRLDVSRGDPGSCSVGDVDPIGVHSSLPRLFAPPGTRTRPCPGGSAGPSGADGAPAAVLDGVRTGMERGPWRRVGTGTASVARSWTRADDRGRPVRVTLAVTDGAAPDCRTLTFTTGFTR